MADLTQEELASVQARAAEQNSRSKIAMREKVAQLKALASEIHTESSKLLPIFAPEVPRLQELTNHLVQTVTNLVDSNISPHLPQAESVI